MSDNPENTRGSRHPQARATDPSTSTSTSTTTPTTTSTAAPSTSDQAGAASLATRIQNSATGLARSAFTGGGGDIAQTLASATDGKTTGSSPGRGGEQGYLASREASTANSGSTGAGPGLGPAGTPSFRETGGRQGGFTLPSMTEEEFQGGHAYTDAEYRSRAGLGHDSIEDQTHSRTNTTHPEVDSLQASSGTWKGKQRAQDPIQLEYNTAWERAEQQAQHESRPTIQPTDGAAVVSLLSDASFDPNYDPDDQEIDLNTDAAPPPLTASEIEILDSFRRQMGSSGQGQHDRPDQAQNQLTATSLIPDIDTFLQEHDPHGYTQNQAHSSTTLRDTVLSSLPGATDWIGVQERYHDEVWGYLKPALEAAKAEMEEGQVEGVGHGGDGPAVRRLRMILEHMKL